MTEVALNTINHLDTHKLLDMLLSSDSKVSNLKNVDAHTILSKAKHAIRRTQGDKCTFPLAKDFEFVVTGHSLGAGVASLLSLFLNKRYGDRMKCYAFSNPCGLMSKGLSEYCDQFVTSLIVGNDIIGRLSLWTMQQLRNKIVREIISTRRSKISIFCNALCGDGGVGDDDDDDDEDISKRTDIPSSLREYWSDRCKLVNSIDNKFCRMYTPGKVLHVVTKSKAMCCTKSCGCMNFSFSQGNVFGLNETCIWKCTCGVCVKQPTYTARWVSREQMQEIIVGGTVMDDHLPNKCEYAFRSALQNVMMDNAGKRVSPVAISIDVKDDDDDDVDN